MDTNPVQEPIDVQPPQKSPLLEIPCRVFMEVYLTDGKDVMTKVTVPLEPGLFPRKKEMKAVLETIGKFVGDTYFKQTKQIKKFRPMNKKEFYQAVVYEETGMADALPPPDLGNFDQENVGKDAAKTSSIILPGA